METMKLSEGNMLIFFQNLSYNCEQMTNNKTLLFAMKISVLTYIHILEKKRHKHD